MISKFCDLWRGRRAIRYTFSEMLSALGLVFFALLVVTIIFQFFNLLEYILPHHVGGQTIAQIVFYFSLGFLPITLPMSLFFAVILTYGRMSADSEVIAFQSLGLKKLHLLFPAFILGILVAILSAQISFYLAPWGNRQMELLVHELKELKPHVTLKGGVFLEGFFKIVVYTNEVDPETGLLKGVFIYSEKEKDGTEPLTIIAKRGHLISHTEPGGNFIDLHLFDGSFHRVSENAHATVHFKENNIQLFEPNSSAHKQKTPLSYNMHELIQVLKNPQHLKAKTFKKLSIELHRRWALSAACLIFVILGAGLGLKVQQRSGKSVGLVICISSMVIYWVLYAGAIAMTKKGLLPASVAMWLPNGLFALGAWHSMGSKGANPQ